MGPSVHGTQQRLKRKRLDSTMKLSVNRLLKSASTPANIGGHSMLCVASKVRHQVSSPQSCLENILRSKGQLYQIHSFDSLPNFFHELKQEEVDAYGFDVLSAVRQSDIQTLRQYNQEGRPLKCSNRFGESLLHLACRKALVDVVDFLVNEVGIPLCVKDDMGRSPLADAFWTIEPNTELVDILIRKCPDLLLISDKRGHTPLAYARKEHWNHWNVYLNSRADILLPRMLNQPKDA